VGVVSAAGHRLARTGLEPVPSINSAARMAPQAALPLRGVLAITDLSKGATNAVWRAGLVARDRKMPLHILSLESASATTRRSQAVLDKLARELRERLLVDVSAQALRGSLLREGVRAARQAALLVIAAPREHLLRDWLLGTRAQQLAQRARIPVLMVRRFAVSSYRKVIVPVALESGAWSAIAAARALSRDPAMKVLHVLSTEHEDAMRLADVREITIHRERQKAADRTREALLELIATAGAHEDCAMPIVSFGHAATRVLEHERTTGADLIVLGQRPRRSLLDLLPGSVARGVLRFARADVLVVPLQTRASLAPWGGLSSHAVAEVCSLHTLLQHNMRLAVNLLQEGDAGAARTLTAADREFLGLKRSYEAAHRKRVSQGDAGSVAFGDDYFDLLADIERMNKIVCSLARG